MSVADALRLIRNGYDAAQSNCPPSQCCVHRRNRAWTMLLCKGQKLFALLFAAMDLVFSRQRDSGTGLFEFDISALIIILPRLENLPQ